MTSEREEVGGGRTIADAVFNTSVIRLERDDLLDGVHDGRVGRCGSSHNIIRVTEVYDDDLVSISDFFTYSNKLVRLERKSLGIVHVRIRVRATSASRKRHT